jgi:preprotein translocase subunit SecE
MTEAVPQQGVGGAADTAKLVAAIALVVAGIAAFYALRAQSDWVRWLAVVAGIALAVLLFSTTASGKGVWQFVLESRQELRKVVWPSRQETGVTTLAVFMFVILAGVFFWALDVFLSWATRYLTGQGG